MTDYVTALLGTRQSSSNLGGSLIASNGKNTYNSYNRVASSANLSRISRDIAQGYNQDIEVINLYLQQGNVDEALALYQDLFDNAKGTAESYGYELSSSQVSSIINQAYTNQTGNTFMQSIEGNTSNPFVTGLRNGIPIIGWFFTQHDSNADALAKVTGTQTPSRATATECIGGTLSGAAAGAGIGTLICPGAGTAVGAIIGGIAGILRGLF